MDKQDFKVVKEDKTLRVVLNRELSTINAPALIEELSHYYGQDIEKIYFNLSRLAILTSAGLRVIFFVLLKLGSKPEVIFVNCAPEIRNVLNHVGLTTVIKFEEDQEVRKYFRRKNLKEESKEELLKNSNERLTALENYEAHNDIVCNNMKMGQTED